MFQYFFNFNTFIISSPWKIMLLCSRDFLAGMQEVMLYGVI